MAQELGKSNDSPREWFGESLVKLADPDKPNFYVFSADLASGTGVYHFREKYPDRHFDVGIAEQSLMGISAGFQVGAEVPVFVTGFASFLSRGWEIARLQIFYNDLPVIIVNSHLGIDIGPDGPSNSLYSAYALWRSLPGDYPVLHPSCPNEMEASLRFLLDQNGPGVLFTGRSPITLGPWADDVSIDTEPAPHCVWASPGNVDHASILILGVGHVVARCVEAGQRLAKEDNLWVEVYSVPALKPTPTEKLLNCLEYADLVITVEDHGPVGGLYDLVCGVLNQAGEPVPVRQVCVRGWGQSGDPEALAARYGLDAEGIVRAVREALA